MNINKRLVFVGGVILILVWIGNIFFYNSHVLKKPIFIKSYYDIKKGMSSFRIYYLENINAKEKVTGISFPELGGEYADANDFDVNTDNRYYTLKGINVMLPTGISGEVPELYRNKIITKVDILLENGIKIGENIGKIYLYNDNDYGSPLKMVNSAGSSDNSGYSTVSAEKDLKVIGVYSKFPEIVKDAIEVKLNDELINNIKFPIDIKKDDTLKISYSYNFPKGDIRKNYSYDFSLDILTKDSDGKMKYYPCFTNYWRQSPEDIDIKSLVKDGGE